MNLFIRRHKVKLAALCFFVGLLSLLRSLYTVCFDAAGFEQSCTQPATPIAETAGGVDPIDAGLGLLLIVVAPVAALSIRRPF